MLFMVIERFRPHSVEPIYQRLAERGRLMPAGLRYVDSWVQADLRGCYQLMECDDPALLQQWIAGWNDLMEFEIVPVTTSESAQRAVGGA